MRMLAVFEKGQRIRHIGHLDIQRAVQRGLRRSGLPVAYSQGYNPHILLTFASALSTGACGLREIMDVPLVEEVTAEEFIAKMNEAMPPELQVKEARAVDNRHPALMAQLCAADYDLFVYDEAVARRLIGAIPGMLEKEQIDAIRKTKTGLKPCDIRPLIIRLSGEGQHIRATMTLTEREACKPGMLLSALCRETGEAEEPRMLVTRTALLGRDAEGNLVPLETL